MTQTRSNATVANACDERGGRIIDHMSTANVARDMELLRRAVGDAKLTYAGYSYGSYLGVTYANLFPDRVRALVVDGVLDPVAWATGRANQAATLPFSTRLRSDAEAQATLEEFFRLCDAGGAPTQPPCSKTATIGSSRPCQLTSVPNCASSCCDFSSRSGRTVGRRPGLLQASAIRFARRR